MGLIWMARTSGGGGYWDIRGINYGEGGMSAFRSTPRRIHLAIGGQTYDSGTRVRDGSGGYAARIRIHGTGTDNEKNIQFQISTMLLLPNPESKSYESPVPFQVSNESYMIKTITTEETAPMNAEIVTFNVTGIIARSLHGNSSNDAEELEISIAERQALFEQVCTRIENGEFPQLQHINFLERVEQIRNPDIFKLQESSDLLESLTNDISQQFNDFNPNTDLLEFLVNYDNDSNIINESNDEIEVNETNQVSVPNPQSLASIQPLESLFNIPTNSSNSSSSSSNTQNTMQNTQPTPGDIYFAIRIAIHPLNPDIPIILPIIKIGKAENWGTREDEARRETNFVKIDADGRQIDHFVVARYSCSDTTGAEGVTTGLRGILGAEGNYATLGFETGQSENVQIFDATEIGTDENGIQQRIEILRNALTIMQQNTEHPYLEGKNPVFEIVRPEILQMLGIVFD